MKPILFNTDMVRAILEGRKTVTRRVVKVPLQIWCDHGGQHEFIRDDFIEGTHFTGFVCKKCGYGVCSPHRKFPVGSSWIRPPYRSGDILYVRETFRIDYLSNIPGTGRIHYKADGSYSDFSFMPERYEMMRRAQLKPGWRPNENMPREAARIFLRVKSVGVDRLQNIADEQALLEGVPNDGDYPLESPLYCPVCKGVGLVGALHPVSLGYMEVDCPHCDTPTKRFANLWGSTIKPSDRAIYGWDANPWVWVIQFERCERPKEVCPLGGAGEGGRLT